MLTIEKTQVLYSSTVIERFKGINNEKDCIFIKFDILEFCPSITERLFKKSILFAKDYHHIPDEDVRTIDLCRKSLLFHENEPWKKKKRKVASTRQWTVTTEQKFVNWLEFKHLLAWQQ